MSRITEKELSNWLLDPTLIDRRSGNALSKIVHVHDGHVELNLDSQSEDMQVRALAALSLSIVRSVQKTSEMHEEIRLFLRNLPDALLRILINNLERVRIAKAAGFALAAIINPKAYRGLLPERNERQVHDDLERLFQKNQISTFSKAEIKSQSDTSITIAAQLWNGLPFRLDGDAVRLSPAEWLVERGGDGLNLEVSGGVPKKSTSIEPKLRGQLACVEQESELVDLNSDVYVYLRWDELIFERFLLKTEPGTAQEPSRNVTKASSLLTKSL